MKTLKLIALLAAALLPAVSTSALANPLPARIAQDASADSAYLNSLYSFLQSQDSLTYTMATTAMSPEESVWAAKMFCQTFSSGVSPGEAFNLYSAAAAEQSDAMGIFTDEMAYAVGLYGGAVMNIGAAHYCPEHQSTVQQTLRAL